MNPALSFMLLAWAVGCVLLVLATGAVLRVIQKEARKTTMAILDGIKAEVQATTQLKASIKLAFDGLSEKLAALASQPTIDPAELQALADELHSDNTDFAALVMANTTAAPGGATSQTGTPAPADLPDGHPLKPVDVAPAVPVADTGTGGTGTTTPSA